MLLIGSKLKYGFLAWQICRLVVLLPVASDDLIPTFIFKSESSDFGSQRIINFTQFLWLNFKRVDHVLTVRMIGKTVVDKQSMKKIILVGGYGRNNFPLC